MNNMNFMNMNNMGNNMGMNNLGMNGMGMNNNQLFPNNFNIMNQMQGVNPNMKMIKNMQNSVNKNCNLLDENIKITTIQEANKIIKQLIKQNNYLNNKIHNL